MSKRFYKVWTHDFRSPIQTDKPVWDGIVPFLLPRVTLDTTDAECAAGWNFVDSISTGFRIAGMWPGGRPSVVTIVEPSADHIRRHDKWRCSALRIIGFATEAEIVEGIRELSKGFANFPTQMALEQILWRHALARPRVDEAAVVRGLHQALRHRGLDWKPKKYASALDLRAFWRMDVRDQSDEQSASSALNRWVLDKMWDTRTTWLGRCGWGPDPLSLAPETWFKHEGAWDAWAGLSFFYASLMGWIKAPANLLTLGLREAYENGVELVLPTGNKELGFVL